MAVMHIIVAYHLSCDSELEPIFNETCAIFRPVVAFLVLLPA